MLAASGRNLTATKLQEDVNSKSSGFLQLGEAAFGKAGSPYSGRGGTATGFLLHEGVFINEQQKEI